MTKGSILIGSDCFSVRTAKTVTYLLRDLYFEFCFRKSDYLTTFLAMSFSRVSDGLLLLLLLSLLLLLRLRSALLCLKGSRSTRTYNTTNIDLSLDNAIARSR